MMRVWLIRLLLVWFVGTVYGDSREAAKIARRMVDGESILHLNTLNPDDTPVSFIEYYVSSDSCPGLKEVSNNGNPIVLLSTISTSFKNWHHRRSISISIENYKKRHFESVLSQPRATLYGNLQSLTLSHKEQESLIRCFIRKHPDAHRWLPGDKEPIMHDTVWLEFQVHELYFIGGFGDRSYIGTISGEEYHHGINKLFADHTPMIDSKKCEPSLWNQAKRLIRNAMTRY